MPILVTLIHQPKSNGLKLVIIFGQRIFQNGKLELHAYWPMTEALRQDQANEINKEMEREISQKEKIH